MANSYLILKRNDRFDQKGGIVYIQNIKNLENLNVTLENGDLISVKHELVLTMINGKVCNAVLDNWSA